MLYNDPKSCAWYGKRAVLYIRVSTDEQARHGYSLSAQAEALHDFCQLYNMSIVREFADEGVSARKEIRRRPGLLQVLDVVRSGAVDYVLFIKLDRWFRSVQEYYRVQSTLDECGVNWKATMEEYDTSTSSGRLNLNIRLSVAQDESDRTSDRIRFVFDQRVKHGGAICGTRTMPYGLYVQDSRVHVDESKRAAVASLFDHYEATGSVRGCIDYLKDEHGVTQAYNTIKRMLSNPLYCGRYRENPEYCPAIVTPQQFERVQAMLARKAEMYTREKKYDYIFTGLLRCPVCGHPLFASPQKDYKYGRIYLRYRCTLCWISKQCTFKLLPWEDRIEKWLLANIRPQLDAYIAAFDARDAERKKTYTDTGKIERKLERLRTLYLDELIDLDAYRSEYNTLKKQLAAAKDARASAPAPRNLEPIRTLLAGDFESVYQELSTAERRQLWASVIDHIVVHGKNQYEVVFLP